MKLPRLVAAACLGTSLHAQGIAGTWQGTVTPGGTAFRQIFEFMRADTGWKTLYFSLDEASDTVIATSTILQGRSLKLVIPAYLGSPTGESYEGSLAADGRTLTGTLIRPPNFRYPLTLHRVGSHERWTVPSHVIRFVRVDTNVTLEVLDWGGTGRPIVFLAGLGYTAHVFDAFAPNFIQKYHVYGITRRGFGASSAPAFTRANYLADRLGDDVLAVIDSLGLRRPVLVGHSIGGEELSSIGSRHPDEVAGLIYLDGGFTYAYYDRSRSRGELRFDGRDLIEQLQQLQSNGLRPSELRALVRVVHDSTLPRFEKDLEQLAKALPALPPGPDNRPPPDTTPTAASAIEDAEEEYTNIPVPILAIYALPHKAPVGPGADSATAAMIRARWARLDSTAAADVIAFENGIPTAHVVRIPNATHFVFRSNAADVLREMNAFLSGLPQ
jgi:pimeloyl-ACP methyl ester carboxylesterase